MNYIYVNNNHAYSDKECTISIDSKALAEIFNGGSCVVVENDTEYNAVGLTVANEYSAINYTVDDIEHIVYSSEYVESTEETDTEAEEVNVKETDTEAEEVNVKETDTEAEEVNVEETETDSE